jgi:hypothetical protein
MARRKIMRNQATSKRLFALVALLAIAVGVPASISAVSTNTSNIDSDAQKRAGDLSVSLNRDQSGAPSPVVPIGQKPPAGPERALSDNPLWEIPLESLSSTRDRPVFSPSRRPPPRAVASAPPPKQAPSPPKPARTERPQLSLVGTIMGVEESFGIFVEQTTRAALRLKLGEDYQGWKLQAVQGREVTLEHDQQTATLTMPQPGTAAQNQPKVETVVAPRPPEPPQRDQRR